MVYENDIHTPLGTARCYNSSHAHPTVYSRSETCTYVYIRDVGNQAHAGLIKNVVSA